MKTVKSTISMLIFFSLFFVFVTASCSKQYTCRCETNDGYVSTSEISEGSRDKSEAACKDQEYTNSYELNDVNYVSTNRCELEN